MGNVYSQTVPSEPTLTEENLPDLSDKCYIVTGGNGGVGKELTKMLFGNHAKVYIATRSLEKTNAAIEEIHQLFPLSRGSLHFLQVDLSDLVTIKKATDEFLAKEDQLDVLWNNAGMMTPGADAPPTPQGHELQMGTNCLGPFLFTSLLLPIMQKTAATRPPGSVRIAWAASIAVDVIAPQYGIDMDNLSAEDKNVGQHVQYAQTKVGNIFLANTMAKRTKGDGIINIAFNPGNLKSDLQRSPPSLSAKLMSPMLYDAKFGGYTELYCGFSPDITLADSGIAYIVPWGRISAPRNDIVQAMKPLAEKGKNFAEKFHKWCEAETQAFAS
ncbi:MAG: hypothetical protein M1814_003788 [Vezdaea aestivalis]|nr:MAG: hypothetical protein M1814_003788 [Vezdaea aestivalis]